jgi:hypothetical protein
MPDRSCPAGKQSQGAFSQAFVARPFKKLTLRATPVVGYGCLAGSRTIGAQLTHDFDDMAMGTVLDDLEAPSVSIERSQLIHDLADGGRIGGA